MTEISKLDVGECAWITVEYVLLLDTSGKTREEAAERWDRGPSTIWRTA